MKGTTIFHLTIGLLLISFLIFSPQASAQDSSTLDPSERYSREELAQMLAPIALYSDALLSQVLMASTYPLEIIEANRWIRNNSQLKGEALDSALLTKDWDPSVKALCHFTSILALMSERITETSNLGNAFLAQEAEVMDMVQELRARAHDQGNLTTTSEQKVIVEKETIIIEPADPTIIYVPYYDSSLIYGPWGYPSFPPYYWAPPRANIGVGISYWPAFYFGFGSWSYFDWHRHYIHINIHKRPRYVRHDRWRSRTGRWYHAPRHRRGVAYRDKYTARKFGQYPRRHREYRRNIRGFPEHRDRDRDQRRFDRDRQRGKRITVDHDRLNRPFTRQERQGTKRVEWPRDKAVRKKVVRKKEFKKRNVDRGRLDRPRTKQERPRNERVEWTRKKDVRNQTIKKEQSSGRSRDNVFNRVEDGKRERQSSKRGEISRRQWR